MGYWSDLINNLRTANLIPGRKNKAVEVQVIFGGISAAIAFLEGLQRGAKILSGTTAPDPADGLDGDAYMNTTTGDFYLKANADWGLAVVLRGKDGDPGKPGKNGRTPVLGQDYTVTNGTDGKSAYQLWVAAGNQGNEGQFLDSLKGEPGKDGVVGNTNRWESYAPTNEAATVGDAWFYSITTNKISIYEYIGGTQAPWRLRFTSPDGSSSGSSGGTNGVTLIGNGDGTKYLANDGTYKTVVGGGGATPVDADLSTNPASPTNAASVKAVNDGLGLKLDKTAKATAADIATGTDNTKYITPQAYTDSTQDFSTYLQDLPAAVVSNITNGANWNPDNRYTGPAIPNGLTMKVYYSYPADPSLPAYEYRFWPGNKVVRLKCTN